MNFCPYLRHEYSSAGKSAFLELTAGTRTVLFSRFFLSHAEDVAERVSEEMRGCAKLSFGATEEGYLFFEQWQRLAACFAASGGWAWSGTFLLWDGARGGFWADDTAAETFKCSSSFVGSRFEVATAAGGSGGRASAW